MRFRLILQVNSSAFGNILPVCYQYEQSAVIYRILAQANEEYATWLHDNGFEVSNKRFKLFTYSRFKILKRQIIPDEQRLIILSDNVEWQITFLPEKTTEKFIQGLFSNQVFEIGDKKSVVQFRVRSVEVLPNPDFVDTMDFSTMSPICLKSRRPDESTEYLSPLDKRAKGAILKGLLARYRAFYLQSYPDKDVDIDFELLNEPKAVLVTLKVGTPQQTKVKGYMCQFRLKAPSDLMKIMYESGIGEECSLGFGCVSEIKKPSTIH